MSLPVLRISRPVANGVPAKSLKKYHADSRRAATEYEHHENIEKRDTFADAGVGPNCDFRGAAATGWSVECQSGSDLPEHSVHRFRRSWLG